MKNFDQLFFTSTLVFFFIRANLFSAFLNIFRFIILVTVQKSGKCTYFRLQFNCSKTNDFNLHLFVIVLKILQSNNSNL